MDDALAKRISDALSSHGGLASDPELSSIIASDPEAAAYAAQLASLDETLGAWPDVQRSEQEWEGLAHRVESHLDDAVSFDDDATQPPSFDDAFSTPFSARSAPPEARQEYSLGNISALGVGEEEDEARPSAPPLPKPTGERASIPEVGAMQISHGLNMPNVPMDQPRFSQVKSDPPKAIWYRRGAVFAAAAVALLAFVGIGAKSILFSSHEMAHYSAAPTGAPAGALSDGSGATESDGVEPANGQGTKQVGDEDGQPTNDDPGALEEIRAAQEAARKDATGSARTRGYEVWDPDADEEDEAAGDSPAASNRKSPRSRSTRNRPAPAAKRKTAAKRSGPSTPSKSQVIAAMKSVTRRTAACSKGRHGVVKVKITVASSGRVRGAKVLGPFSGTPEGKCIARAVRSAKFPAFSKKSFGLVYPFRI